MGTDKWEPFENHRPDIKDHQNLKALEKESMEAICERWNAKNAGKETNPPRTATVIPLPVWPESLRGVPNGVLRSALFGAIKRGRRKFQEGVLKASVDGVVIRHTGPQLDQADLDVWEQCLHLARVQGLGIRIEFAAYAFLKSIDRATGGKNTLWLIGSLRRLTASVVEIQDGARIYAGPLIHHLGRDEVSGRHVIILNPKMIELYRAGWTQIEWEQRQTIRGQPLAQWLHGFYCTHASPFPLKVETLHRLAGSEIKLMKHFRAELRDALEKLIVATGWTYEIDKQDLVHVKKTPTPSQARHLSRRN